MKTVTVKKTKPKAAREELSAGQDFIRQGNPPAMAFEKHSASYSGVVTGAEEFQVRDFDTKEPMVRDDGSPIMALAIIVANEKTGELNTYYCKSLTQQKNLGAAYKQAGIGGLAEGDHITITYTADKKTKYGSRAKVYDIIIDPA